MLLLYPLFYWSLLLASAHPIYISTTEIHYRPERQAVEVQIKFFSDDIQEALQQITGDPQLEIGTDRERPKDEAALKDYLKEELKLLWDGEFLDLKYLGKEVVRDGFFVTYVYLEAIGVTPPSEVQLQQSMLIQHQPKQKNVVHFFMHKRNAEKDVRRLNFYKGRTAVRLKF